MMKTIILLFIAFSQSTWSQECSLNEHFEVNQICTTTPDKFHPTQFTVGMTAMSEKQKGIEEKFQSRELSAWLATKAVPAIWGPDKKLHITDRHHTSLAVLRAEIPLQEKIMTVQILGNYSSLNWDEFYTRMVAENNAYLNYLDSGPRSGLELPETLSELENDPYRSLAWLVRENNGFEKVDQYFLEFIWANFFRQYILLSSGDMQELEAVLFDALILAHSELAENLPGHIPGVTNALLTHND